MTNQLEAPVIPANDPALQHDAALHVARRLHHDPTAARAVLAALGLDGGRTGLRTNVRGTCHAGRHRDVLVRDNTGRITTCNECAKETA